MSGIFGFKNLNLEISKISEELLHNNKNDFNYVEQENLVFCQCRIKIGNTPVYKMDFNGNLIAFNGEIYNYKDLYQEFFNDTESASDVEVLMKLLDKYGLEILNKLNGMFSFAYYEKKSGSTFLVNDRYGVKQLFYYVNGGSFAFSTEDSILTRMLNIPFSFNDSYVQSLFVKDIFDFENKLINPNIHSVFAGEYVEITKDNEIKKYKYYHFDDFDIKSLNLNCKNEKEIINYFEELLTDAIRIRTATNQPIAMTLSGGIDSSLIYTLAKEKLNLDVNVFTYSNADEGKDEFKIAKKLVERYGDKIIKIEYDKKVFEENFKKALVALNAPCCLSDAEYYKVYKIMKETNIPILLEGHGSDEVLGGYVNLYFCAFEQAIMEKKYTLAFHILSLCRTQFHPNELMKYIKEFLFGSRKKKKNIFTENLLYLIIRTNLPKILRYWDRMLVDNSVELRTPFLDYRVFEFLLKLPTEYKINKIGSKAILREILKKYKIDFVYKNKIKRGFTTSEEQISKEQKDFFLQYYDKDKFNLDVTNIDNNVYKACCVGFLEDYYKNK